MPDADALLVFAAASVVLAVVPGPAVIYIVTRSVRHGRAAGLVSTLGVELGNMVHVAASAVGLSALLASSATAFNIVRYAGAAYLVFLGVRVLLGREDEDERERPATRRRRLFWEGAVVSALNPKTALFFLAFLPQFVDPAQGAVALQALVLGTCFVGLATVSDSTYALLAGTAGNRLRRGRLLARMSGGVYLGLGAFAALAGERPASD
ncbi:MAG TPA: LysE family translocator [Thermoleophilaceae bacterium]|nr:LysE family translocator [Thermoleophilaceae bacterium]